jgi:hypothetical protein
MGSLLQPVIRVNLIIASVVIGLTLLDCHAPATSEVINRTSPRVVHQEQPLEVKPMPGSVDQQLLQRGWLHAHEEDAPGQAVFRPDTQQLPPSRGRTGYEFQPGGRVVKVGPGPTDRRSSKVGTWSIDPQNRLIIRMPGASDQVLQIETLDADRLVIKK